MSQKPKNIIDLGINIDHVATLRNARGTVYPDPIKAAQLAEQYGADLLAMTIRRRTFTEKLLQRSMTKRMAYHAHLPLMTYHTEK